MDDVRGSSCDQRVNQVFTFTPRKARFARFRALSFHGTGAALQRLEVTGPSKECVARRRI